MTDSKSKFEKTSTTDKSARVVAKLVAPQPYHVPFNASQTSAALNNSKAFTGIYEPGSPTNGSVTGTAWPYVGTPSAADTFRKTVSLVDAQNSPSLFQPFAAINSPSAVAGSPFLIDSSKPFANTFDNNSIRNDLQKPTAVVLPHSKASTPRPPLMKTAASHNATALQKVSDLGAAVRNARKSKRLTQQEFADLAGVGRRFLSELESGKPTLEIGKVLKVAAAAGIQLMFVPVAHNE